MTRRQTGLLLALSWALLLPPWETNGSQAPLTRWQHAGSFDSAKECEAARAELIALPAATRRSLDGAGPRRSGAGRAEDLVGRLTLFASRRSADRPGPLATAARASSAEGGRGRRSQASNRASR